MKVKQPITVMLFAMAITVLVVHSIAEGPKEVEEWFHELSDKAEHKMTKLHFYFHDLRGVTSATVAQSNTSLKSPTFFGVINMMDDPLTAGPSQASKVIGRAQGLYGSSSMEDMRLLVAMNLLFTDGDYNGSSLTVLGTNPIFQAKREMPVIGGSGIFRLARGVALLNTYFFNAAVGNATVEYNVIVHHY